MSITFIKNPAKNGASRIIKEHPEIQIWSDEQGTDYWSATTFDNRDYNVAKIIAEAPSCHELIAKLENILEN